MGSWDFEKLRWFGGVVVGIGAKQSLGLQD
jgi:hypothetical protein